MEGRNGSAEPSAAGAGVTSGPPARAMSRLRPLGLLLLVTLTGCDRVSLEDDVLSCDRLDWTATGTVSATIDNESFRSHCLRLDVNPGVLRVVATDQFDPSADRQIVTVEIPSEVGSWDMESSPAGGEYAFSRNERGDRYFYVASGTVDVESVTDDEIRGAFEFVVRNEGGDPARLREGRFRVDL